MAGEEHDGGGVEWARTDLTVASDSFAEPASRLSTQRNARPLSALGERQANLIKVRSHDLDDYASGRGEPLMVTGAIAKSPLG
jgi:hypothetical protein